MAVAKALVYIDTAKIISIKCFIVHAYNDSIVVEHSPQHPKVYGLRLAPAAGTGRENVGPNLVRPFYPHRGVVA